MGECFAECSTMLNAQRRRKCKMTLMYCSITKDRSWAGWVIINFYPIQKIEPEVGGGHSLLLPRVCIREGVKQLVLSLCQFVSHSVCQFSEKFLNISRIKRFVKLTVALSIDIAKKSDLCVLHKHQSGSVPAYLAVSYLTQGSFTILISSIPCIW